MVNDNNFNDDDYYYYDKSKNLLDLPLTYLQRIFSLISKGAWFFLN